MEDLNLDTIDSKELDHVKLCILFAGEYGSGKTYSSLQLATEILKLEKEGKTCLFIDTENAAQYYAKSFNFQLPKQKFVAQQDAETVTSYLEKLLLAIQQDHPSSRKIGAVIIDSVTDIWVESLDEVSQAEVRGGFGFNGQREHGKVNLKLHKLKNILSQLRSYIHVFLTCKLKAAAAGTDARTKLPNVDRIVDITSLCDFANIKKDFFYLPPIIALNLKTKSASSAEPDHKIRVLANKTDNFLLAKSMYKIDQDFIGKLYQSILSGEAKENDEKAQQEEKTPVVEKKPRPLEAKTSPQTKAVEVESPKETNLDKDGIIQEIESVLADNQISEDDLLVYLNNHRKGKSSDEIGSFAETNLDIAQKILSWVKNPSNLMKIKEEEMRSKDHDLLN